MTLSAGGDLNPGAGAEERVVAHSPAWKTDVTVPAAGGTALLRVYLSSPIGGVYADITPGLISRHRKVQFDEDMAGYTMPDQRRAWCCLNHTSRLCKLTLAGTS